MDRNRRDFMKDTGAVAAFAMAMAFRQNLRRRNLLRQSHTAAAWPTDSPC